MKRLSGFLLFFFILNMSMAQDFYIEKIIDLTPAYRAVTAVGAVCNDNGYYLAAKINNISSQVKKLYLCKLNSDLDTVWTSMCDMTNDDNIRKACETTDKGCFIMGDTKDEQGLDQILAIKFDSTGNFLWKNQINPGYFYGMPDDIIPSENNTVLLSGGCVIINDDRAFFMKVSPNGTPLWTKYYDDFDFAGFCKFDKTADGNFVLGYMGFQDMGCRIAKVDPFGNLIWNKFYPPTWMCTAFDIVTDFDGGFVQIGYNYDIYNDGLYINKTDNNGIQLWTYTVPGYYCYDIERVFYSYITLDYENIILKLAQNGNLTSAIPFKEEYAYKTSVHFYKTNQNDFYFVGVIKIILASYEKIFIGKTDLMTSVSDEVFCDNLNVQIFPNPVNNTAHLKISEQLVSMDVKFVLYALNGRIVRQFPVNSASLKLDLSELSSGVYTYGILKSGRPVQNGKIVINK
jgi:hypothetical protein